MLKLPIWVFVLLVFFPIADSIIVITVGLHLKRTAKEAVIEGAEVVKDQLLTLMEPMLKKFGVDVDELRRKAA